MKLFGFEITRQRQVPDGLNSIWGYSPHWRPMWSGVAEPYTGAWQRNVDFDNQNSLLMFSAVFCCVTGIASDIAKNRVKLCRNRDGIWDEVSPPDEFSPFLPVLNKPNHFQNHIQFIEHWIESKLLNGNTYVLLERDNRMGKGIVNAMYVLDPCRVKPMVADNGDVFYDLGEDYLNHVEEHIIVPASEIIHDRMNCLWHPLIGVSPLYACALSVLMGNKIQSNSTAFFANRSLPGGMLTAPGRLNDETAQRIKANFEDKFSGVNMGRLFVAGDGLKFEPFTMTAEQSDLVKQLEWSVGDVARAFHYPQFKLTGNPPPYAGSLQSLDLIYYKDCLQEKIEKLEACLDEGLSLPSDLGTELDVDNLMRMDANSLADQTTKLVGGGIMAPNEAREKHNLHTTTGGEGPYLQQQNYSLAALAKRDAQADPFESKSANTPTPAATAADMPQRGMPELEIEEYAFAESQQ